MTARIDRIWPAPVDTIDDEGLLAAYAFPKGRPWLRMNFISSIDGAATRDGLSGGLGDAADRRLFDLLRRPADAILVAAGTVRAEGYGAMRLDDDSVAWRTAAGLPPHPVFVIVSRSLELDPASPVFTDAPVRPVVCTVPDAPADRRAALEAVADVVEALGPQMMLAELASRGLAHIHSEGGPSLFGSFLAADAVDELCLTIAPTIDAGTEAGRIARAEHPVTTAMRLESVLRASSELFLRYVRA